MIQLNNKEVNNNLAILGGDGFLGYNLSASLGGVPITRKNYKDYIGKSFNTIINCVGNKYTYIAEQNPILDLESSLIYSYKTINDFKFNNYIYLSSVAVYDNSTYGMHKRFCEDMLKYKIPEKYLILRPCNIISKKKENIISDIFYEKKVGITENTMMHFLDISEFLSIMTLLINMNMKKEVINIGSNLAISTKEIGNIFKKEVKYKDELVYKNYNMNTEFLSNIFDLKDSSFYIKREFLKNEEK